MQKVIEKDQIKSDAFAEVVESCLYSLTAQSWRYDFFPNFGSLIIVEELKKNILGIVTSIETGSMDPMRTPFVYKKTEEELLEEQPQIFEFLKTTFKVQIVGFLDKEEKNKISYLLPQKPCKIHAFIKKAPIEVVKPFFSKADFLNLLFAFSNEIKNLDELLLAILNNLNSQKMLNKKILEHVYSNFSLLTGNDYRRLKIFLKRIEKI